MDLILSFRKKASLAEASSLNLPCVLEALGIFGHFFYIFLTCEPLSPYLGWKERCSLFSEGDLYQGGGQSYDVDHHS